MCLMHVTVVLSTVVWSAEVNPESKHTPNSVNMSQREVLVKTLHLWSSTETRYVLSPMSKDKKDVKIISCSCHCLLQRINSWDCYCSWWYSVAVDIESMKGIVYPQMIIQEK